MKADDLKKIKFLASKGEADAIYEIGRYHYIKKEYKRAYTYFSDAADKASGLAQYALSRMYMNGEYVKQSADSALTWLRIAASNGLVEAIVDLSKLYLQDVDQHPEGADEAIRTLEEGAAWGYPECMTMLAELYRTDDYGVKQDDKKSYYWIVQAAEAGDHDAQNDAGYMLDNGIGCVADSSRAFFWFQKAVANHSSVAQFNLGEMYELGKGTQVDMVKAIRWYARAAKQGMELAQQKLTELTRSDKVADNKQSGI